MRVDFGQHSVKTCTLRSTSELLTECLLGLPYTLVIVGQGLPVDFSTVFQLGPIEEFEFSQLRSFLSSGFHHGTFLLKVQIFGRLSSKALIMPLEVTSTGTPWWILPQSFFVDIPGLIPRFPKYLKVLVFVLLVYIFVYFLNLLEEEELKNLLDSVVDIHILSLFQLAFN